MGILGLAGHANFIPLFKMARRGVKCANNFIKRRSQKKAAGTAAAAAAPAEIKRPDATQAGTTAAAPDVASETPKKNHIDNLFKKLERQKPGQALTNANAGAVMPPISPIRPQAKAEQNAYKKAAARSEEYIRKITAAGLTMPPAGEQTFSHAHSLEYSESSTQSNKENNGKYSCGSVDSYQRFSGGTQGDSDTLSSPIGLNLNQTLVSEGSYTEEAKGDTPDGSEASAEQDISALAGQYQAFRARMASRNGGLRPPAPRRKRTVMPRPSDLMQKHLQNNLPTVTLADPAGQRILDNFEALYRPTDPKYDSRRQSNTDSATSCALPSSIADSTTNSALPSSMTSSNMVIVPDDTKSTTSSTLPSSIANSTTNSALPSSIADSTISSSDASSNDGGRMTLAEHRKLTEGLQGIIDGKY